MRISCAAGDLATTEGLRRLGYLLFANEERLGLARRIETAAERFSDLLVRLHSKTGRRVVVLVDEYDKPILDALGAPEIAEANRDRLASVFSVVKDLDEHVRFSFFTGVTKFSKANLFSTLNNLTDISLDPAFAAVCGFTDAELDAVFADPLAALDVDRDAVREWYNGYNWLGEDAVYCPYDVLNLFRTGLVRNYWIKTGTPAFLPPVLVDRGIQAMEQSARWIDEDRLEDFDIGRMDTAALLFQTGYLTIAREHDSIPGRYWLDYPNREVGQSLSQLVVAEMLGEETRFALADDFRNAVASVDFRMLHATLSSVLAGVPYDHYRATPLARIEGHYAAVMDTAARMAGLNPPFGGEHRVRPHRHDRGVRRPDHAVRVEGRAWRSHRPNARAAAQQALRGEVSPPWSQRPLDRRRVRLPYARHRRLRHRPGVPRPAATPSRRIIGVPRLGVSQKQKATGNRHFPGPERMWKPAPGAWQATTF